MYQKIFSLSTGFEIMNNRDIYTYDIHINTIWTFTPWLLISIFVMQLIFPKKKTPMKYLFNIEILFKSKIIAYNKLETKLHIYPPNIHSIHIMALHLA